MAGEQRNGVVVTITNGVISISRPGTALAEDYKVQSGTRKLIRVYSWSGPNINSPEVREFRAAASKAAYDKARELRWID
jgi:hypothetical protein